MRFVGNQLVKNMKTTLNTVLLTYACFLKQKVLDHRALYLPLRIKVNLYEFSESGAIVVIQSFGVSKRLK